jgi:hypothetical protein
MKRINKQFPLSIVAAVSIAIGILATCDGQPRLVTQTFSDLEPTQPMPDEVTATPVNLDSSFAHPGPPVPPGPAAVVDSHFFEHVEEDLEASSAQSLQTFNAAAVGPGEGRWIGPADGVPRTGENNSGDVAIHAALLRTGVPPSPSDSGAEILWFAGDVNDNAANAEADVNHTGIFRFKNLSEQFEVKKLDSPIRQNPLPGESRIVDLFCSGHALLGDGRLLVAGGTEDVPNRDLDVPKAPPEPGIHLNDLFHYPAIRDSFIFDPKTNAWSEAGKMIPQPGRGDFSGGRWYPSLLTLSSGRVAAFWGHPANDDTRHTNDTPEIFSPETLSWALLGTEDDIPITDEFGVLFALGYPRVHLLPNGWVFRASPVPDGDSTKNVVINPIPQSLTDPDDPNKISLKLGPGPGEGLNITGDHWHSSVLLPLTQANKYRPRVLLAGGGRKKEAKDVVRTVLVQPQLFEFTVHPQLNVLTGEWHETASRKEGIRDLARADPNATILPTGEIFVSGGVDQVGKHVLDGEIYNPFMTPRGPNGSAAGGTWRTVAAAKVGRDYHSVALLMPDGRIWHASTGSGKPNVKEEVDIYEPWYYSKTRPIIRSINGPDEDPIYAGAPVMHLHDSRVTVAINHFRSISKFVLVRAGSVTHAFNYDQRYVELQSELLTVSEPNPIPPITEDGRKRFTFRLTSPPSSNIAPPGNYLLFAIDDRGVPSVGRFIRLDREFVGDLKQEAEDVTFMTPMRRDRVRLTCLGPTASTYRPQDLRMYGGIDFGTQAGVVKRFSARVCTHDEGTINMRLDRPDGPQIATLQISPSDVDQDEFIEQTTTIVPLEGVHNVFITFVPSSPNAEENVVVDWLKFKQ